MNFDINTKDQLELFITNNWNTINSYLDDLSCPLPTPIYSSVDIRESKTKFAPVDLNIYPAGFNNLCQLDLDASTKVFRSSLKKHFDDISNITIIPESHTKNLFYLDHLAYLQKTLRDAGYNVNIATTDESLFQTDSVLTLISHSKFELKIYKAHIDNEGYLWVNNKKSDLALLNNDQSEPLELNWDESKTPITPTPKIGWFRRQKSEHFTFYKEIVETFSKRFSIDPMLIMADFKSIEQVDFSKKDGLEKVALEIDKLKTNLPLNSKIFVKAGQGTYGMGISVVQKGRDIIEMNRKARNKMDVGKNKIKFTSVVIQEGVDSILKYDDMPAEVAIYLVDGKAVGGFLRANSLKDNQSNLNSKGMIFKKYCISEIRENSDHQAKEAIYSVIARLSTIAGAKEIQHIFQEGK